MGVPFYLKIDIEGNDYLCIRDLAGRLLPPFISVEAENTGDNEDLSESFEQAKVVNKKARERQFKKPNLVK